MHSEDEDSSIQRTVQEKKVLGWAVQLLLVGNNGVQSECGYLCGTFDLKVVLQSDSSKRYSGCNSRFHVTKP